MFSVLDFLLNKNVQFFIKMEKVEYQLLLYW